MLKICLECGSSNSSTAIVCANCGSALLDTSEQAKLTLASPTATLYSRESPFRPAEFQGERKAHEGVLRQGMVAIYPSDTLDPIIVPLESELTLGRAVPDSPTQPDVDLMPFRAYEKGVSRVHAALKVEAGQVLVEDKGSSNGTWVNGVRLGAYTPTALQPGDTIWLGHFPLQLFFVANNR